MHIPLLSLSQLFLALLISAIYLQRQVLQFLNLPYLLYSLLKVTKEVTFEKTSNFVTKIP